MKSTITSILLLISFNSFSQDFSFPKLDNFKASINNYYLKKSNAECQEFKTTQKTSIWDLMPNPSYSPFTGGFGASLNLQTLITGKRQKQEKRQKIASIIRLNQLEAEELKNEVSGNYEAILISINDFLERQKLAEIRQKLFNIYRQQYEKNEITPTAFISHEFEIESLKIERKTQENLIKKDILLLKIKAKNHF
jgi:hypothetical protein